MTQGTLVKICGLRDPAHAIVAAECGAAMIGLVFYPPSPRFVSTTEARRVADALRGTGVQVVGLFVNTDAAEINRTADRVGLDLVQLSGDETPSFAQHIERPVIATIRASQATRATANAHFQAWTHAQPRPWAILVDAQIPGRYGGTGEIADWEIAGSFARDYRTVLAGGLTPETVADAIRIVNPAVVDVSSGVETNGKKNTDKIRAFIEAACTAVPVPLNH